MKAMATSLLACTMALLAMSEFQAEDCDESVAESMRTELLQSTAVLANTHTHTHVHTHTGKASPAGWRQELHPVHHTSFLPPCS